MKNFKTILLAITVFALLSFTFNNSSNFQENLEDIGIIKQSLLKPNQFNKTQKGTWVLLNGQEIYKDSELYKLLDENFDLNILTKKNDKYFLPNASGAFIRASNVNGEGKDPDTTRKVGSLQLDGVKKHNHGGWVGARADGNPDGSTDTRGGDQSPGGNDRFPHNPKVIDNFGIEETRPVNISLYTYIKISN
ncbi:hypothetical protein [Winogradskyella sp. Asnod2-B02-A]|uniref:hypothetical protein n=1 Tax=Winogradskyella sp. Asnod2-B02-A TaxID=3160583 RepID=UPI003864635A